MLGSILHRFGKVGAGDGVRGFEVGDGLGDFYDAVDDASGEVETSDCGREKLFLFWSEVDMSVYVCGGHISIGMERLVISITADLTLSRDDDIVGNLSGGRGVGVVFEYGVYVFSGDFEDDVDTIQEWSRDFGLVAAYLVMGAFAGFVAIAIESAGAGVHRAYEHKIGRILYGADGTRDGDGFVFDGLAEDFEHLAGELRKLIEKKYALVCQGHLTWCESGSSACDGYLGCGVVDGSHRALDDEWRVTVEFADDGVDLTDFEYFIKS